MYAGTISYKTQRCHYQILSSRYELKSHDPKPRSSTLCEHPTSTHFKFQRNEIAKRKKKQPKGHRCRETSPRSLSLFRLTLRCCCCQSPRVHSGGEPMLRSDPRFLEFPCYRDWIHVLLLLRLFCLKLHRFSFFCYHECFFFMYFVVVRCV